MSATSARAVAVDYCAGEEPSVVLQIDQGLVDRGAESTRHPSLYFILYTGAESTRQPTLYSILYTLYGRGEYTPPNLSALHSHVSGRGECDGG